MSRQYEVYVNELREKVAAMEQREREREQMVLQLMQQQTLHVQQHTLQMTTAVEALVSRIEALEGGEPSQPAVANGKVRQSRKAHR